MYLDMILIKNYTKEQSIYVFIVPSCQPQCSVSDHTSLAAMATLCSS